MNDTDFEASIAATMRPYGQGDVDVAALRAGTMVRVRAARRRRTAAAATGTALALTVTVFAGQRLMVGDRPFGDHLFGTPPSGAASSPGEQVRVAAALPAADAPGAAQAPDQVGTDPALLHFDLDVSAFGGTGTSWLSTSGVERGEVWTGRSGPGGDYHKVASVTVARTPEDAMRFGYGDPDAQLAGLPPVTVSVDGRPGTLLEFPNAWNTGQSVFVLRWQPASTSDGLWAALEMPAADAGTVVAAAATGIRLDRAQRCAVPLRVTAMPANSRWESCDTGMEPVNASGRSWQVAGLTFRHTQGGEMRLSYGNYSDDAAEGSAFVPNRMVGDRPAMWYSGQGWQLAVPGADGRNLFIGIRGAGYGEADALALAAAVVRSEDLIDLESWPARVVG
jgi:hypothetical protein